MNYLEHRAMLRRVERSRIRGELDLNIKDLMTIHRVLGEQCKTKKIRADATGARTNRTGLNGVTLTPEQYGARHKRTYEAKFKVGRMIEEILCNLNLDTDKEL